MKLLTTLHIIRNHKPCANGWKKLLKHVGTNFPEDAHIDFATILESNGLDDALWALRAVLPEQEKDRDRLARLFACDVAESVLHLYERDYPGDTGLRDAIRVSRAYAIGKATDAELDAAWAASCAASRDAACAAACAAAWAASWAASRDAQTQLFKRYFCQD